MTQCFKRTVSVSKLQLVFQRNSVVRAAEEVCYCGQGSVSVAKGYVSVAKLVLVLPKWVVSAANVNVSVASVSVSVAEASVLPG